MLFSVFNMGGHMELKVIEVQKSIKEKLQTPMPDSIVKEKPGQSKASYVTGQSVIDKLNATFGYAGWSWEICQNWIEQSSPKMIKAKWENGRKVNIDPPIIEPQPPVAHVVGKLTVYLEKADGTIHTVSKMAPGAQPITGGQSEQESCFKSAHTDAIKKAATMFGIALELYRDNDEQQYHDYINYENPWTEQAMETHKDDLKFLKDFRNSYGLTDEDMNNYMYRYSGGTMPTMAYLLPDNINGFAEYLKSLVASATNNTANANNVAS